MKFILTFLLLVSGQVSIFSQSMDIPVDSGKIAGKQHAFYIELLGNGFFYSVNYDWIFIDKRNINISGRVGLTYMPHWERFTEVRGPGMPLELNFLIGKKSNFIELGLGATYFYFYEPYDKIHFNFLMETLRLGWRYQRPAGGLMFRVAVVPIATFSIDRRFDDEGWIVPYFFGISIGYTFLR